MATMTEKLPEPSIGNLIGQRILTARKGLGWSQQQLAIQAGVTRSWVASLEAGNIDDPGTSSVTAVARAMGVDPIYMITGIRATDLPDTEEASILRRLANRPAIWLRRAERWIDLNLNDVPEGMEPPPDTRDARNHANHEPPEDEGSDSLPPEAEHGA